LDAVEDRAFRALAERAYNAHHALANCSAASASTRCDTSTPRAR